MKELYLFPSQQTLKVYKKNRSPVGSHIQTKKHIKLYEKILIVHESYGNPLVPFFTYNYKEVHSIDFRYWKGNLYDYCVDNNITNVVFANGVMSAATATQLDAIESLLG